jgi:hypothetical protein
LDEEVLCIRQREFVAEPLVPVLERSVDPIVRPGSVGELFLIKWPVATDGSEVSAVGHDDQRVVTARVPFDQAGDRVGRLLLVVVVGDDSECLWQFAARFHLGEVSILEPEVVLLCVALDLSPRCRIREVSDTEVVQCGNRTQELPPRVVHGVVNHGDTFLA